MTDEITSLKEKSLKNFEKNRYQQALEGFQSCLKSYEELGDVLSIAEMRNNISVTYVKLKNGPEALAAVLDTDQIFLDHGDRKRQAMAMANNAAALELLERYEEALEKYQLSLDIFKEIGEKEMRTSVLRRVADLQLKTKRQLQAIASMEAAYDQSEKPSIKDSFFKKILSTIRKKLLKQN
jgi:tetratricopeptide (TPR) repeat protein